MGRHAPSRQQWLVSRERRKRHPVKQSRDDPNHRLGPRGLQKMTHFLQRAPARWGNEALLGCSFYIFL